MGPYGLSLLICYGTSLLLVLAYFAWEDGPFHYSRRIESMYLSTVLSLIYICSCRFGVEVPGEWQVFFGQRLPKMRVSNPANVLFGLRAQRHTMLLLVLVHIAQQFIVARVMPSFYETPGYFHVKRWQKLCGIAKNHPRVVRVAAEIRDLLSSTVKLDSGLAPERVNSALDMVLLLLLLVSEFTAAHEDFWHAGVVLGDTCEVLAGGAFVVQLSRRLLLLGQRVQRLEQQLDDLVRERRRLYLLYVLATVSVGTLMEVSKGTLELLTNKALAEGLLDTTSKAVLIDALQRAGLRSTKRQEAIARLVTSTFGSDLTKLKNLVDGRGGYHNLYKLVYQDITIRSVRERVLRHIEAQARVTRRQPGWQVGIKVLSDIDDTLYSSGGHFPAGCDRRFPKGLVYPGCLTLFRVLDKGFQPDKPSCNLVFLSARPHIYKAWTEDKSYRLFADLLEQERIHSFPTLLPGQLWSGLKAMLAHCWLRRNKTVAWAGVGMNKYEAFLTYLRLYLEYDFVFCGDDGQGDLLAAQYMLDHKGEVSDSSSSENSDSDSDERPLSDHQEAASESRLRAALIREVCFQDGVLPLAREPPKERDQAWYEEQRQRRLLFHRTYVGAAVDLHRCDPELVSVDDVASVATDAMQEFEEARLMYPEMAGRWEDAEEDFRDDLRRADEVLQQAGRDPLRQLRSEGEVDGSEAEESSDHEGAAWTHTGDLAGRGALRRHFVDLLPKPWHVRR